MALTDDKTSEINVIIPENNGIMSENRAITDGIKPVNYGITTNWWQNVRKCEKSEEEMWSHTLTSMSWQKILKCINKIQIKYAY